MTVKSNKAAERLDEIIDFDFSKPLTQKVREELTVKLCGQFLEPLNDAIGKFAAKEGDDEEEEKVKDKLDIIWKMNSDLTSVRSIKSFESRNVVCNGVLPFISAIPVPEWEQRDVPVIVSFGFYKNPVRLQARKRSIKLLKMIEPRLEWMFEGHEITEVEINEAAKVPFMLCTVDDVTVIIKISVKPFISSQYLSSDVINIYKKYDDRFVTLANYFHNYLKTKVINKRDVRKAKSVIPKLCSVKMLFIHCFKHYGLLPVDLDSLDEMMESLDLSAPKPLSLGTLYFLFLDYYLDIISLEKDYLEIMTGEVMEKKEIGLTNLNILSIADIFDDHLPGERVNDTLIFKRILKASFNSISKYLSNRTGDVLNDLRVIPLRPKHVEL